MERWTEVHMDHLISVGLLDGTFYGVLMELQLDHFIEEWLDYDMVHLMGYWMESHSLHLAEKQLDYEMAQLMEV